jgi:hypothetical protein
MVNVRWILGEARRHRSYWRRPPARFLRPERRLFWARALLCRAVAATAFRLRASMSRCGASLASSLIALAIAARARVFRAFEVRIN